jgi:branched-chain amino acid transport system substrate-binding protein
MKITKLLAALGVCVGLTTAVSAETLKVGVIAPLSGAAAPWGIAMAEGAKLIAKHLNDKGGLDVGGKKYQVEVIAYDDMYSAPGAVAAYNRLVNQDGVKYIEVAAGVSTMAVKSFAKDDKVVIMTSGYIAEELDPTDHYIYRIWGVPSDFFAPEYDALLKALPNVHSAAIVNPNDESARQSATFAEAAYKRNGVTVTSDDLYERSLKDFLPLITKILANKPDLVDLCTTAPAQAALLVRQLREFGFKGPISVTGATAWKEIVAGAGKNAAEGVVNVLNVDPKNTTYNAFAAEFTKAVGQEPNDMMAGYSDGMKVVLQAISASGSTTDTSKFEAGFAKGAPYISAQGEPMGVGGKEKYGLDHQVKYWRYLAEIRNGAPVVIGKFQ